MDVVLIVIVTSLVIVGLIFKDFKSEVYFIGTIDILFRILHKFTELINIKPVTQIIEEYIPESLESLINYYTSGVVNTILIWILFIIFCYFTYYLITYWLKKRK